MVRRRRPPRVGGGSAAAGDGCRGAAGRRRPWNRWPAGGSIGRARAADARLHRLLGCAPPGRPRRPGPVGRGPAAPRTARSATDGAVRGRGGHGRRASGAGDATCGRRGDRAAPARHRRRRAHPTRTATHRGSHRTSCGGGRSLRRPGSGRAARLRVSGTACGVDGVPAPRTGSPGPSNFRRPGPSPWSCRHREERRDAAPSSLARRDPAWTRIGDQFRAHPATSSERGVRAALAANGGPSRLPRRARGRTPAAGRVRPTDERAPATHRRRLRRGLDPGGCGGPAGQHCGRALLASRNRLR